MNKCVPLVLTAAVALALTAAARAADDWQYWNQLVLKHKVTDRVTLTVISEQKFRDDFSDFYLYNGMVVPTVRLREGVSLGAGYRWERLKTEDDWTTEHRLMVPLTLEGTVQPWSLRLRSQLEYRNLETGNRWRLRERLLVTRTVHVGGTTVAPFASEEIFYDFTAEQRNQNRLTVGLSVPWAEHTTLSFFYASKAERNGDWSSVNVLGTEVAFEF
jgi:hypothetical protein